MRAFRLLGFFLLVAGGCLVFAAVALLESRASLAGFVVAGIAVEIGGFVMVARSFASAVRARVPDKY